MTHIKAKHPECILAEGRSLLGMGFTITGADDYPNVSDLSPVDDGHFGPDLSSSDVANDALDSLHVVGHARTTPPTSPSRRLLASAPIEATIATVERRNGLGAGVLEIIYAELGWRYKIEFDSSSHPFRRGQCGGGFKAA